MKCVYCGKTCPSTYCSDDCSEKARRIEEKAERVSVPRLFFLILAVAVVTVIVVFFYPLIGIGIMCLGFGAITLYFPYVTEETLTLMSIRTSLILMRFISVVLITSGLIAICMALMA